MSGPRSARLWCLIAVALGSFGLASALPSLIKWDPIKQVWIDTSTKGVVTVTSNSVTNPAPGTALAVDAQPAASWTQQGNTRPQRPSDKSKFPLIIPDPEYFKSCFKNTSDPVSMHTTGCDLFKDVVNCQQLAAMGYLPPGTQSFVPGGNLNGGYTLPNGCSSGNLGIEYDGLKMVFNSPQIPILAVIAKDLPSKVYYFGSGVTQGKLLNILMKKAEFCYAPPSISPLYVSKTASYSTGMQPGTAAWNFFKTASLAPPFSNNIASLFRGDTADVTWTLSVQKTGTDTVYQGAVTGQITITNPQPAPVTVYNINDYVQGGPSSTVSCGAPIPFVIQPCSSTVCNYVTYWPLAPQPGTFTNLADVQYSVGDTGVMGNQVGTAIFQVGAISEATGMVNTAAGAVPAGQAIIQDGMAPQPYYFSGTTQQSYSTQLSCGASADSAIITNQAQLTAATGQTVVQTATVQKLCFELQVRVAQAASPFIGRWSWGVSKSASTNSVTLKPSETAWDKYVKQQVDLAIASGQDPISAMKQITGGQNFTALASEHMAGVKSEDVTYTVTFTRTPPAGAFVAGQPAFQTTGDVYVSNASPLNAQLKEVQVQITNPFGGLPYSTTAQCPLLTVAAGQTLQCRYVATPSFNPIGAQVTASAVYLNTRNGVPTGATTAFLSAPVIVGTGVTGGGGASRRLQAAKSAPSNPLASAATAVLGSLLRQNSSGGAGPTSSMSLPPLPQLDLQTLQSMASSLSTANGGENPLAGIANFVGKVRKNLQEDGGDTAAEGDDGGEPVGDSVATAALNAGAPSAEQVLQAAAKTAAKLANADTVVADVVAKAAANLVAPTAATPSAAASALQGLQDECVDVKDLFARGEGYVTGLLTAGTIPAGRICDTTTFTYTVRYGPFSECFSKTAGNQASFYAPDSQTVGNATTSVDVRVQGCGADVAAKAKSYAAWAKRSYTWTVAKASSQPVVQVGPGQFARVNYTVSYVRSEITINPKLSTTIQFDSLSPASAVTLTDFGYTVTSKCPGGDRQVSGSFKCAASTIPAGGAPLTCQLQADLPCTSEGVVVAHAMAGDNVVNSAPFKFPAPKVIDTLTDSECAVVVDEFSSEAGLAGANITYGVRPFGKLCGSKDFTYTAEFGPFTNCGRHKAVNTASLTTGPPTNAAGAANTLYVDVVGCEVYTPMGGAPMVGVDTTFTGTTTKAPDAKGPAIEIQKGDGSLKVELSAPPLLTASNMRQAGGGSVATAGANVTKPPPTYTPSFTPGKGVSPTKCVSPVAFWKNCMVSGTLAGRCAVVLKLPTGPHTAFFPLPNQKNSRTYKAVMIKPTSSGSKNVDAWWRAAQAVVATQLNELAGVQLPSQVRDALSLVGAAISSTTAVPPTLSADLKGVPPAVTVLEKFSSGQLGVPTC